MRWINGETWESKKQRLGKWHKWFAWFPVTIGETKVGNKTRKIKKWLCYIERKLTIHGSWDGYYWTREYRERFKKDIFIICTVRNATEQYNGYLFYEK